MRWFIRNDRFYIGPVSDTQIDALLRLPKLQSAGVSCMAGSGRVETYVTVKTNKATPADINSLRLTEPVE